jgi:hypothetical protein
VCLIESEDGFELDNDSVVDDEIEPMASDFGASISNNDLNLPFEGYVSLFELNDEGSFVNCFKKSWSQISVHLNCSCNNLLGKLRMS